jgi:hypothetical protein
MLPVDPRGGRRAVAAGTGTATPVMVVLTLGLSLLVDGRFSMPVRCVREGQGCVRLSGGQAFECRSKGWEDRGDKVCELPYVYPDSIWWCVKVAWLIW